MKYQIAFELPGLPKMTNPSGARSSHWAIKAAEAKKWKTAVFYAVGANRPSQPLKKARLVCTRWSSSSPDADGLVSGFKHIIDGLVESGVLENDRWENIGMPEYKWEKCRPKEGKVRVEAYEL